MRRLLSLILLIAFVISGCTGPSATPTATVAPTETPVPVPVYQDASQPIEARVEDLLARMTLEEKIGQMTQVENNSILAKPSDITLYGIGSVLSGGGGSPTTNTPEAWAKMTDGFQDYALKTRLGIPLIYGVDAVHGHNNLYGATIFPHNIGLGAAGDPQLVQRIGRATAEEMAATGIWWDFAPVVAVVRDTRWGRTYEGYSENTALVTELGTAAVRGLQTLDGKTRFGSPLTVLATPKHYLGDGGTTWGSSRTNAYKLDQGDTRVDEATLRTLFLPPYKAVVKTGAMSIMPSFSSWNGTKMHANQYLLTDVLKGELGFDGFLISDWQAVNQIPGAYFQAVGTSINAGLDMVMVPYDYKSFVAALQQAIQNGDVPLERIDDAVRRILRVKFELGLFERPYSDPSLLNLVGSEAHRELAREAVQKSLVLLKNENATLPLSTETPLIFVAGQGADDIGLQCGGWTITWQGKVGDITPGTTILGGIQQTVSASSVVKYDPVGLFADETDNQGKPAIADVGIVVFAEKPYAEGQGDKADPRLTPDDLALLTQMRQRSQKLVVVLLSGRPIEITDQLPLMDAFVAAWLPGTEGAGVADGLFGNVPFTGKLPYTWQRRNSQLPFDFANLPAEGDNAPLFPFGYGLTTKVIK
jgi:beta-glucosidase